MCFVFFVTITFLAAPPTAASSQLSTQALCEPWPRLPTQHRARVGGLMEYGSNWPPIQSCGLQVSLSSERTQMDAHILKVSLQFSHFALGLFGCVARTVVAPTASLRYCAHLYRVTKFDFTDIQFRVILPSAANNGSNITPQNMS